MSEKFMVTVCTAARGGMRSVVEGYDSLGLFERLNGIMVWSHREGTAWQRVCAFFASYFRVLGMLLRRRVSLLHVHSAMRGSFWRKAVFSLTGKALGVPVLFHLHGSEFKQFHDRQGKVVQRMIRWVLESVDIVIVLSQSWADYISRIAPLSRVRVVPNFVPDLAGSVHRDRSGRPQVTLLFLGYVGQRKGVYDLLPVFADLVRREPRARLLVAGNGEVEEAKQLAQSLGLYGEVEFAGWIDARRRSELLAQADLFILPSYNEGLPMSILEAMSFGLPVVSTKVGGIPELFADGRGGALFEPGDRAAMLDALTKLVADPVHRQEQGRQAREKFSQGFAPENVMPRLMKVYEEAMKETIDG